MKLGIMQPYFFPYIGYFQAIHAVDKYILYENLSFIKEKWMNRNRLLLKNGNISLITVPLENKSSNVLISNILIDNKQKWNKKLLKTIFLNYKGSSYFDEIYPFLTELLNEPFIYLHHLNEYTLTKLAEYIGITTTIEYDNEKYQELENHLAQIDIGDYSDFPAMAKTKPSKKVVRVLAISDSEGAKIFVNAIGGQKLYDKNEFARFGIDLKFIQMEEFMYPQFTHNFVPDLSIIDVLMHNGKDGTSGLIKKYTLV